jgi:hypothetical protein
MPGGRLTLSPTGGTSRGGEGLTLLIAGPPDRSGGVGGLQASDRSLRRPAKWLKGIPDDTMSWDLILDIDAVGGPSIERRLRVLRDMGQPDGEFELPRIRLSGDVWVEDQNVDWAIAGITFGERLYNGDGTLRRQHVKVDLERYEQLSEIKALSIRSTRKGGKRRRRVTIARGNDTLRGIALRELGDATRWKDLQRWNKTKLKGVDPDARLRTGLHLTVR